MKRVIATGTFDGVHKGHEYFLREARKLGDWLGVVIARDMTVEKVKGRQPTYTENERRTCVQSMGIADLVVLGYLDDKYKIIKELNPDIIALGYDQSAFTDTLIEELKKRKINTSIVRIDSFHPEMYKSSLLAKRKDA